MEKINWQKIGLEKPPSQTRVVVAMSGGVDSSVTAALLAEAGFEVVGITLQLYDHGMAIEKKNACCAGQDIYDAKQVAEKLGFPHYVLDYESRFNSAVIDDFADTYLKGETPIPCVRCNQTVKFRDLLETAQDLQADALVTGHYVQRHVGPTGAELHRALDPAKDQSYFLFATSQDQLDYLRFPLGGMDKTTTRRYAQRFNLSVAEKPDSQDICFVPAGKYADLVAKLRPESLIPGHIVHQNGQILGAHQGIINFTVGQRKGLGIGGRTEDTDPLYVIELNPQTHEVIVGPKESLARQAFTLESVNWLGSPGQESVPCTVKIRSTHTPVRAHVSLLPNKRASVRLEEPEFGLSPGQACVFYEGTRVLGGGWISATEKR